MGTAGSGTDSAQRVERLGIAWVNERKHPDSDDESVEKGLWMGWVRLGRVNPAI